MPAGAGGVFAGPGGWGRMGWTTVVLANAPLPELEAVLEMAWRHALPKKGKKG